MRTSSVLNRTQIPDSRTQYNSGFTGKRVVYQDDFESGLNFLYTGTAAGTIAATNSYPARFRGSAGIQVTTPATLNSISLAYKQIGLPPEYPGTFSFAFFFRTPFSDPNLATVYNNCNFTDGTNLFEMENRYQRSSDTWQIVDSTGLFVSVTPALGITNDNDSSLWHYVKMTQDWKSHKWQSLQVDNLSVDLTSHSSNKTGNATSPRLQIGFGLNNTGANASSAFFDDILFGAE